MQQSHGGLTAWCVQYVLCAIFCLYVACFIATVVAFVYAALESQTNFPAGTIKYIASYRILSK